MKFRIGKLRQRIELQSVAETTDGMGGFTEVWSTFATVWADIRPVSTNERFYSQQLQATTTHKVIIRTNDNVTEKDRLIFDGRTFQIKGILRDLEEARYMTLECREGVGT